MQTQIRLLLEEQSDQGLHCLLFHLHLLNNFFSMEKLLCLNFRVITAKFSGVRKFRNFTVLRTSSMHNGVMCMVVLMTIDSSHQCSFSLYFCALQHTAIRVPCYSC